ncbi:MAG: carbamoyl-phosphate synthase large subunit [Nitrososphaerota archaeon]
MDDSAELLQLLTSYAATTGATFRTSCQKYYTCRRCRPIIRRVGVETGGSNIQFAVDPASGRTLVIEMNPRVSRSSALASKATGFPIARIAAKLAVGYRLDELPNTITLKTPASFEPAIDYVVVKIPRWAFEKFPDVEPVLGTQMKAVGEVMAIGRTFREALLKGLRSLEGRVQLGEPVWSLKPHPDRLIHLFRAFSTGAELEEVYQQTRIDRWFLEQVRRIAEFCTELAKEPHLTPELLLKAKRWGLADAMIADLREVSEKEVRARRQELGVVPVYKRVDTCAAEFESHTPYLYSTYEEECEAEPTARQKIMILGSGPNRIGQGIEFDYCCCHASFALKEAGYETILVNCNPETVSTDYDTSDRLYFEPVTFEDVLNIVEKERPLGVIVQLGGQTPLNLARRLLEAGVPIIGTSPESIDLAEDRERFGKLLAELQIPQPANGIASSIQEAREVAARIGYPVLVRPSYVLGGRAMVIVYDEASLEKYMREAVEASPDRPVLIDSFLESAVEVDVDALSDGERTVIAGIQEHIEEAGIHSGDSSCVLPAFLISSEHIEKMRVYTRRLAAALNVVGLVNIQFAIKDGRVYVLEVNPRASRTVPFVSKATGVPLAKIAALLMIGRKLSDFSLPDELAVNRFYVKTPVFPFVKFPGVDPVLGPEMRSTGEVMGVASSFQMAYYKALLGAGLHLPQSGEILLACETPDVERELIELYEGFTVRRPSVEDGLRLIDTRQVSLLLAIGNGRCQQQWRRRAVTQSIAYISTLEGARAAMAAIQARRGRAPEVLELNYAPFL